MADGAYLCTLCGQPSSRHNRGESLDHENAGECVRALGARVAELSRRIREGAHQADTWAEDLEQLAHQHRGTGHGDAFATLARIFGTTKSEACIVCGEAFQGLRLNHRLTVQTAKGLRHADCEAEPPAPPARADVITGRGAFVVRSGGEQQPADDELAVVACSDCVDIRIGGFAVARFPIVADEDLEARRAELKRQGRPPSDAESLAEARARAVRIASQLRAELRACDGSTAAKMRVCFLAGMRFKFDLERPR